MRIITNDEKIVGQLLEIHPEYLAYATGKLFLQHLLTDDISDVFLKYQQNSIINYIHKNSLNVTTHFPCDTENIGCAVDQLEKLPVLKTEHRKDPKYHRYI